MRTATIHPMYTRYVVSVDRAKNTATAGIREVKMSHAYAGLDGAAFCVMYKSKVTDDRRVGCRAQPTSLVARVEPRKSTLRGEIESNPRNTMYLVGSARSSTVVFF